MEAAILLIIIPLPFFILAIVLSKGKGASLLAGYNTMPDSEKAKYDEAALCQFMGKIMYGISFSLLLFGLSELLDTQALFIIDLILFIGLIIFALVYANTGNRFKKNG